jgi:hypothetical protein
MRLLIAVGILVCAGCTQPKLSQDAQSFRGKVDEQKAKEFLALPYDKQIDVFLEVARSSKPGDYFLAYVIEDSKEPIHGALEQRLKSESEQSRLVDLIELTSIVCRQGRCENKPSLISSVRIAAGRVQKSKARADDALQRIERTSSSSAPPSD